MAACAAALPTAAAPAPSLDKAILVPTVLPDYSVQAPVSRAVPAPVGPPLQYSSPSTLSIRFCTFQE